MTAVAIVVIVVVFVVVVVVVIKTNPLTGDQLQVVCCVGRQQHACLSGLSPSL